jgi:MoxR-like ATPase
MDRLDLGRLIPDQSFYNRYIPRVYQTEHGDMTDVEILEIAIKKGKNTLLMGPTGPGKTSLYYAVCAKNQYPLGTANLNGQSTVEDLVGQIIPTTSNPMRLAALIETVVEARDRALRLQMKAVPDATAGDYFEAKKDVSRAELNLDAYTKMEGDLVWVDGLLVRLMRGDPRFEHTVFLADEVNFAPAKVMAILNGVTDDRRQVTVVQHEGEVITAHPGFHFGAAMNPSYEGTRNLNKAFRDRFHVQLYFDYDPKVEGRLIPHERLLQVVRELREMMKTDQIVTPVSTRMMLHYLSNKEDFGLEIARLCFTAHFEEEEQLAVNAVAELKLGGGRGHSQTPKFGDLPDSAV